MVSANAPTGEGHAGQFTDAGQRRRADSFGMWLFLSTEVMLFSGIFAALLVYRIMYPADAKEVARHLQLWIAAGNTAILLTGSLTAAAAHTFIKHGQRRGTRSCLFATAVLGVLFLALKAFEYHLDIADGILPGHILPFFREPAATLFVDLYYIATGLHALHLTIAVTWFLILGASVERNSRPLISHVHIAGLYWHFVDVVWIFLYPVLYLARTG